MTLDDIKVLLAGRLGQRTDIDNMIYSEIRQAQRALEKTPPYPWFLYKIASVVYDQPTNPLPDDFIELFEDWVALIRPTLDTNPHPAVRKIYGGQLEHVAQPRFGRPENFYLTVDTITFYPYLDVSYDFNIHYYGRDVTLAAPANENLWSNKAEDLLIAEAGWHVARNIRDAQRAAEFGQDRAEARRRIAQESTSRLESMRRAVIGAGEDALLGQSTREDAWQ